MFDACAIIVAGGESRRMGRDKSMLPYRGAPLIQHLVRALAPHFSDLIVSTNSLETHSFLDLPLVPDRVPGRGPMGGIYSAVDASVYDMNFVVACDVIQPSTELIARLLAALPGHEAAVPVIAGSDCLEPLFAAYGKAILPAMHTALEQGQYKLQVFLRSRPVKTVTIAAGMLTNINTAEDYTGMVNND
jgi:molybdenum cofactor guanylyltransferase